jgi:hypothetical protein
LQLVRRLGESGSLQLLVREQGSTADVSWRWTIGSRG